MTELKYGGSDVKIMYGSQEISGATKLEPSTILFSNMAYDQTVHLANVKKDCLNINGFHAKVARGIGSGYTTYLDTDISIKEIYSGKQLGSLMTLILKNSDDGVELTMENNDSKSKGLILTTI